VSEYELVCNKMPHLEIILIGICSCIIFDLWQRVLQTLTSIPPSNWALVGRWFIGLASRGRLIASQLSEQPTEKHETLVGWIVHYGVGVFYAYVFAVLVQFELVKPTIIDGLLFGIASVIVPWLFFMPALGIGILANKAPNPRVECALALMMHSIFGLSLGVGFSFWAA